MTKTKRQGRTRPSYKADLEARVERAIADARATVRWSEVLVGARQFVGDENVLISRCAWCGRHALADHWLELGDGPAFLPADLIRRATHGICPSCAEALRRDGLSR